MPRVRNLRASADARARCERQACRVRDLLERQCVEPRRDLALEPRVIALAWMLARPAAIMAVPFADRLAPCAIHDGAAAWIVACRGLRPFLLPFASGLTERIGHFCDLLSHMRR
jgi:hypothetical protein